MNIGKNIHSEDVVRPMDSTDIMKQSNFPLFVSPFTLPCLCCQSRVAAMHADTVFFVLPLIFGE